MPQVVNGIGTWYYGKSNRTSREAPCPYCGSATTLASYDTRLWFVVIFVPIIPLGKKRITDECVVCRRHTVAAWHKWKDALKTDVTGAFSEWQQTPTAQSAGKAFGALIGYRQIAEAGIFADEVCAKLPAEHDLHATMAGALAGVGEHARAAAIFERVHAARPEMPEARVGVANARIREGKLDEARPLLAHIEAPGAAKQHSLEPMETLANAYQAAGRHVDALDLYTKLVREIPAALDHDGFRKRVAVSEKALGKKESILPKRKFSLRRLFSSQNLDPGAPVPKKRAFAIAAILIALFIGGIFVSKEYGRRHRKVYIVNAFEKPATVIVGSETHTAPPGHTSLELNEGNYHVKISGPVSEEFDCDVTSKSSWTLGDDPVWVINVGGRAILVHTTAIYRASTPPPPDVEPVFGQRFMYLSRITHPFQELPTSVKVKRSESKTLSSLEIFGGEPYDIIAHFATSNRPDEALRVCEWHLGNEPNDGVVLDQYVAIAPGKALRRVAKFLASGLELRPVNIPWHREYQTAALTVEPRESIVKLYDAMLAKEPGSSALLYLRGRLCENSAQASDFYKRAQDADDKNPWPSYALSSVFVGVGDWKAARIHSERAVAADPDHFEFRNRLYETMLGVRDFEALQKEHRAALEKSPIDFGAFAGLVEALVAAGKIDEAKSFAAAYVKRAEALKDVGPELAHTARGFAAIATGDYAAVEKLHAPAGTAGQTFLVQALVAQGKLEGAQRVAIEPDAQLLLALGWHLRGDAARFAEWRDKAAGTLANDPRTKEIAELLRSSQPVTTERMALASWPTRGRSLLACVLAISHPPGSEMRDLARKLNIGALMPAPVVARFLDSGK